MTMLYEEKVAKRFAKIVPIDFDFWAELDSALATAFTGKEKDNPATVKNYDKIAVSIAYIFVCYGMYELHLEGHPNRFERMKETHPKQYDYIMNKLNGAHVINEYLKCDPKERQLNLL